MGSLLALFGRGAPVKANKAKSAFVANVHSLFVRRSPISTAHPALVSNKEGRFLTRWLVRGQLS